MKQREKKTEEVIQHSNIRNVSVLILKNMMSDIKPPDEIIIIYWYADALLIAVI